MLRSPTLARLLVCAALAIQTGAVHAARANYPLPPRGTVRIGSYYAVDPVCASTGLPSISLVTAPSSGQIETRYTRDYPDFPTFNVRVRCDTRKVPVTEVLYRPAPGFRGIDFVVYDVIFPRGQLRRFRRRIVVR